ncbi:MAG: hypothetical protein ACLT8E_01760 [Akkermansia sp.]
MPPAWIIPLGHLNLLVTFCALLLLTMAAACACLLCIGKRGIRPTAENATGLLNPAFLTEAAEDAKKISGNTGMNIP